MAAVASYPLPVATRAAVPRARGIIGPPLTAAVREIVPVGGTAVGNCCPVTRTTARTTCPTVAPAGTASNVA